MWYEFFTSIGAISAGAGGCYLVSKAYDSIKKYVNVPPKEIAEMKEELSLAIDEISGRIYEGGFPKSEILREKDKIFVLNTFKNNANKLKRKTFLRRHYINSILKDIEEMKRKSEISLRDKQIIENILDGLEI